MNDKPKILVIGCGYLAEYLIPCYEKILGDEMATKMIGIKGSALNLEERQSVFPYPIQVQGTKEALEVLEPDLILLMPKPNQVDGVVRNDLVPYYEKCRQEGKKLPILYSFAPDPPVDYFYKMLGDDIYEANMLPCMVNEVAGVRVAEVGVAYVSFQPGQVWPEEARQAAMDFMTPTGTVVEVDGDKTSPLLAVKVATHVVYELNYIFHDVLAARGVEVSYADAASSMRGIQRDFFTCEGVERIPYDRNAVDEAYKPFLEVVVPAWSKGILDYAADAGLPDDVAARMAGGTMELHLMTVQHATKEQLEQNTKNHATKGGVLEKGCTTFAAIGWEKVEKAFHEFLDGNMPEDLADMIHDIAYEVTKAVSIHCDTLGGLSK